MAPDLPPFLHRPRVRACRAIAVLLVTIAGAGLVAAGASAQTLSTLPTGPNDTVPFVAPTSAPPTTAPPATAPPPTTQAPPPASVPAATAPPVTLPPITIPKRPVTTKPKAAGTGLVAAAGTRIEVDISSQTMRIFKSGKLYRSVKVSTGSGRRYCEKGVCGVAVTPRGRFKIYNRINGWRTSRLGQLYNPLYFRGGFAIHGSGSVPSYPASHGCVRVTMATARWLPGVVPNGTPVWVHE